jgi:hypothetical protein
VAVIVDGFAAMHSFKNAGGLLNKLECLLAESFLSAQLAHDVTQEIVAVREFANDRVVLLAIEIEQAERGDLHLQQSENSLREVGEAVGQRVVDLG